MGHTQGADMAKRIFFFMTKEDLLELADMVERNSAYKYLDLDLVKNNENRVVHSLKDVPHLGISNSGKHITESHLIMSREQEVLYREVSQKDGTIHYFPSEDIVSNSVAFFTGGMYEGQYLVSCEISTASKEETAMEIFRVFSKAIKKLCKYREGTYWYTEGVRQLNGVRLITMSYEENPMYDIAGAGIVTNYY